MTYTRGTGFVLLLVGLAACGCDTDPGKGKSKAGVGEAVAVAQPSAPPAAGTRYAFSHVDSKVEFVGAKITRKHEGSFGNFSGTVVSPDGKAESSTVTVEIEAASIEVDNPKLTGHLRSPDFLDVITHPKVKFVSTGVKPGGDKGATHTVTGNLEMHGITRSISFPATIRFAGDTVDADAEFAINRKDFGIMYPGAPDDLIADDVAIELTIRAKKG